MYHNGMSYAETLRTGKIVRYTDPRGNEHDAMVDIVKAGKVRVKLQHGFQTTYVWTDPDRITVPR